VSCLVNSVAYQLVVSSRYDDRLSRESLAALRAWVAKQSALLRTLDQTKGERRAQRAADSALVDLEDLVTSDLGATTVSSDVELGH
jgi:hypothetical protein